MNNVKTENMLLLDKVKYLELDLSVARSVSSKLDQLLGVQKSPSDKSGLCFVEIGRASCRERVSPYV